ncbi:DNA polymerase-3 subunit epsilon [Rhodococcus sp. PvR044]|uniref:3'-5' exonuclease n=1 Tax=Rhodococcus sp. PvR044 TaxID=3156402 RepID=UPI00339B6A34
MTVTITPREWAISMLAPGVACILDVETTGFVGSIIEAAVIDAATGETLLDTLVDPGSVAIEPEAQAVHGITAADLVGAPTWREVLPALAAATAGRIVLAYNAPFDRDRVLHDCRCANIEPGHLFDPARWHCIMARRSEALGTEFRVKLDGGHRALGDVHAARAIVQMLATGHPDTAPGAVQVKRELFWARWGWSRELPEAERLAIESVWTDSAIELAEFPRLLIH